MIQDEPAFETGRPIIYNNPRHVNSLLCQFVMHPLSGFIFSDNAKEFHVGTQSDKIVCEVGCASKDMLLVHEIGYRDRRFAGEFAALSVNVPVNDNVAYYQN